MNIEALNKIKAAILDESVVPHFNMASMAVHDEDVGLCIGGVAYHLKMLTGSFNSMNLMHLLDLTDQQRDLFFPPEEGNDMTRITRQQAVTVIDHMIDTGDVDWSLIDYKELPSSTEDDNG